MVEERSTAAAERRYGKRVAVLLAAAAVTGALIGARTANLAGSAGGKWESAIRVEVKREAAKTTGEILVYGDTLPTVTSFQKALIRANQYSAALGRPLELTSADATALTALAQIELQTADSMTAAVEPELDYFLGGNPVRGFDLDRRLADQTRADLKSIEDPAEIRAAGDDSSRRAVAEALAGLPAALAFMVGSIAGALRRGRVVAWWIGAAALAVSVAAAVVLEAAPVA